MRSVTKELGGCEKAFRRSSRSGIDIKSGAALKVIPHIRLLLLHVALLCHGAPLSWLKRAASSALDEPRAIPDGVADSRRVHASGELVEDLLGDVMAQTVELRHKSALLCFRHAPWKTKATTTVTFTVGSPWAVFVRNRWLLWWMNT
jgi:hypothetical protein